ncbi:hypothetical protein AB1K83_09880 [Sporosarcina sp. 179-K 3D1 HS]
MAAYGLNKIAQMCNFIQPEVPQADGSCKGHRIAVAKLITQQKG